MDVRNEIYLQTGQVGCYDQSGRSMDCAGSGQDAEFGDGVVWRPETRFRVRGGIVLDTATGLHWLRDAGYGEYPKTWQEAHEFISQMNNRQVFGGWPHVLSREVPVVHGLAGSWTPCTSAAGYRPVRLLRYARCEH